MIPLWEQPIYIVGNGRVGRALRRHFTCRDIRFTPLRRGWDEKPPREGLIFLAIPDREVFRILSSHYDDISESGLRIVHFSAGIPVVRRHVHLLHPFASIERDTDLADILFLWFGHRDDALKRFLETTELHAVPVRRTPSVEYHTAAVILGNFSQYLYLAARDLLMHEKIPSKQIPLLLRQLLVTSIRNVEKRGRSGITGPASRNDTVTINHEALFLENKLLAPRLAKVYRLLSDLIAQAVNDGTILG